MLINSTDEFKSYVSSIHKNLTFPTVQSFIDGAEVKYILPFVGPELMAELQEAYDGKSLSEDQARLLKLLGKSIAYYSVLDALPFINISVGDAGVVEGQSANFGPARQWSYFKFEDAAATNADVFLDLALQHLDENKVKFPKWVESSAYKLRTELFINSAADLSRYLNLQGSRRAFMALAPFQYRAQDIYIEPLLGGKLYQELQDGIYQDNLKEQQKLLVKLIKPALAQLTLFEAIPEISYTFKGSGLKILNENDGIQQRLSASSEERSNLRTIANSRANIYLEELKRELDKILQEGEVNPDDRHQTIQPIDNSNSTSFWV